MVILRRRAPVRSQRPHRHGPGQPREPCADTLWLLARLLSMCPRRGGWFPGQPRSPSRAYVWLVWSSCSSCLANSVVPRNSEASGSVCSKLSLVVRISGCLTHPSQLTLRLGHKHVESIHKRVALEVIPNELKTFGPKSRPEFNTSSRRPMMVILTRNLRLLRRLLVAALSPGSASSLRSRWVSFSLELSPIGV